MARALKVAVVALAVTGLMLWAAIRHGTRLRAERPLRMVPATSHLVARIEIGSIGDREAVIALLDRFVERQGISDIEVQCGLDPFEDLREVVLWVGAPEGGALGTGMLVRGGTVNAEELARCYEILVEARGGSVARASSPLGPLLTSSEGRSALARVDGHTIVTGSAETVAEFVSVTAGTAPPLIDDEEFRRLWARVHRGPPITGAFVPPPRWQAALERIGQVEGGGSALAEVVAVGLTTSRGGDLEVLLEVNNVETAREDGERMHSWIARALGERVEDPGSAMIAVDGTSVTLTFPWSPSEAR